MKVDYIKCDKCGTEGNEKFTHLEAWTHYYGTIELDLCSQCTASDIHLVDLHNKIREDKS